MSKYSSKNAAFQFGLLLFMVAGLSFGIILTTGKASLSLFSFAQVQTNYKAAPELKCREDAMSLSLCPEDGPCVSTVYCKYGCKLGSSSCNPPTKPAVPTSNPVLPSPPLKPRVPTTPPRLPGCISAGQKCTNRQVCCGYCNNGVCKNIDSPCIVKGRFCNTSDPNYCCGGSSCSKIVGGFGVCR
jgi:hypothetical protein